MQPPRKPSSANLAKTLVAALKRSRAELVPEAFQFLWMVARFIVAHGGRASAKSWSIVRVLLILGMESQHLILCARESQSSIKESAYRLLCDQIRALGLDDFYTIGADKITGRNGTEIIFEGLFRNAERLRSYEGISIVWVEEAHRVSEKSWEDLIPTVRKGGSRFFISFNPSQVDDPVWQRFVASNRPDVIARRVTWKDNPFLSPEMIGEKDWCAATDLDQYRHVWEGEFRTVTEAQILRGKYVSEAFEVDPQWSGPHYGLDFGFSQDPTAGTISYVDDKEQVLYIAREFWKLGADLDSLPDALRAALPGINTHTVYCDCAQPAMIDYLSRHGLPAARPCEKWSGSVDDGIMYLRSFSRIVIHPTCVHTLDEANRYSFKVDRLTGNPLPEAEDKNNHCVDSIRYGIGPIIRNKPSGGYFARSALLVNGEAVEVAGMPQFVFSTASTCDAPGTSLAIVHWVASMTGPPLIVLDWELIEPDQAGPDWFNDVLGRMQELVAQLQVVNKRAILWIEEPLFTSLSVALRELLASPEAAQALRSYIAAGQLPPFDVGPATDASAAKAANVRGGNVEYPPILDERAELIRSKVNLGRHVKLSRHAYTKQTTFRTVTSNHLLNQLLGFRIGTHDVARPLVAAFALGFMVTQFGE